MNPIRFVLALAAAAALFPALSAGAELPRTVTFRNFFEGMTFNRPLAFSPYQNRDSVYIVVEQVGKLRTVERRNGAWAKTDSAEIPLTRLGNGANRAPSDVFSGIHTGLYESRGLLGFAFHPQYGVNRKYYVSYVTVINGTEHSVVAERIADSSGRPRTADPQRDLLRVNQDPYWDHKGGHIGFGPDGFLYFTLGDGGNVDHDPLNRSQNPQEWFGKALRLDVDRRDPGKEYAVPPDNPFLDSAGYLPEIWALGLRNPWKWTFHPITGRLWLGDVGNTAREEISIVRGGANMGWKIWEGNYCHYASSNPGLCAGGFAPPVLSLQRSHALSVTGGAFFLGDTGCAYHGTYIFGDYIQGHVWAMRVSGETLSDSTRIGGLTRVVSFDRDHHGRLIAVSLGTGSITPNTGSVSILESPDMRTAQGPVRLAVRGRIPTASFRFSEFLKHRERYVATGLDGRLIEGTPSGIFLVRDRAGINPPRLVSPAW